MSKLKFINYYLAIWNYFCFLFGVCLVCLSDEDELPLGYRFLKLVESSHWEGNWEVLSRCWKTVGSVLVVYAINELPLLQRLFNTRPIQYLGRILCSLYLMHQSVYHLVRDPIVNILWYIATREPYTGTEDTSKLGGLFAFTWLMGYMVMSAINLYTAHLYTKHVDERCVRVAKRIDTNHNGSACKMCFPLTPDGDGEREREGLYRIISATENRTGVICVHGCCEANFTTKSSRFKKI